jgi:hypothetical protein
MTNSLTHYATCQVWESGNWADCTCYSAAPWKIRKEPQEQFPWRIWRRTSDESYEPLMRCSTFAGAVELIKGLVWLRENALHKDGNV